jgi:hypothetical protein
MTDPIINSFYEKMAHVNLEAYGILDSNNQIHTLGTDSKIIGRIFEMFAQPVLEEIAKEMDTYCVHRSHRRYTRISS